MPPACGAGHTTANLERAIGLWCPAISVNLERAIQYRSQTNLIRMLREAVHRTGDAGPQVVQACQFGQKTSLKTAFLCYI